MSAYQAQRQFEREEEHLGRMLERGEITQEEYWQEHRELRRDLQAVYEQDQQDALDAVRDEWGW